MMPATGAMFRFGTLFIHFTELPTSRSCENSAVTTWSTCNSLLPSGRRCRPGCSIRSAAQMTIGLQPAVDMAALLRLAEWLQAQDL